MKDKVILLVEDNPDDRTLILRVLDRQHVANSVVAVSDGVEALDYLFRRGSYAGRIPADLPQLVLLDLKLPRVDGLEVLREIRQSEATRLLPVVILTSSGEERDLMDGYSLGANSYVRKPIRFEDLAEAVRQLGLYWLVLNQPCGGAGRP
jgi:CheY-like chemotaxis protein